ncbi:amphi-Trp domain-containing protein [Haloplanus aerogenes]|uniref:Amphi-Trp domain-containing protein n=1 Tax=Haloplanus aerogenes TaxID=660522 RepID=A0A3M0E970_9EURY|nr:amphi-Trp domain-containing protein [Haloplanus aerogenes]AZH24149.1 amphi-Trp domain-containing protein [Haloplanus aerogenes]RMB24233.1 amphi-Trp domain-containing protein [Haloplanus aerogenes]
MPESPTPDDDRTTISDEDFAEEYHVSAAEAGKFLTAVGERLQAGDDVTLSGDDWELDFAYREPVELEVEHVGGADPELEIELELSAAGDSDSTPNIG